MDMEEVIHWNSSKEALLKLESVISCNLCERSFTRKFVKILTTCGHLFCGQCVRNLEKNVKVTKCPLCKVFFKAWNVTACEPIKEAISIINELSELLSQPVTISKEEKKKDLEYLHQNLSINQSDNSSNCSPVRNFSEPLISSPTSSPNADSNKLVITLTGRNKEIIITSSSDEKCPFISPQVPIECTEEQNNNTPYINSNDDLNEMPTCITSKSMPEASTRKSSRLSKKTNQRYKDSDDAAMSSDNDRKRRSQSRPRSRSRSRPLSRSRRDRLTPGTFIDVSPEVSASKVLTPMRKSSRQSNAKFTTPKLNVKNKNGETKLHVACIKGDLNAVNVLLESGANANVQDNSKWTPLHEACNHGYRDIAERLLNYGAIVDAPGYENDTPLHDAVRNGRLSCVKLLMTHHADIHSRNKYGYTALSLAKEADMREALQQNTDNVISNLNQTSISLNSTCGNASEVPCVILLTGVGSAKRRAIQKVNKIFNAQFISDFSDRVTHIVSVVNKNGRCPRTLKYLKGILKGKWIIDLEWLENCLKENKKLPEINYEIVSALSTSENRQNIDVPKRGRMMADLQKPPLFDGCSFFLKGDFIKPPNKASIEQLIIIGGGIILKRSPKVGYCDPSVVYHSTADGELTSCATFLVSDKCDNPGMLDVTLCECNIAWILECIASLHLIDPKDYNSDNVND